MKSTNLLLPLGLLVSSVTVTVSAWEFEVGTNGAYYKHGSSNKGCTQKDIPEGTFWRWDRDPSEDCCLRLWANSACSGKALGWTCDPLDHRTTNFMRAWKVTDC
ncbi:hypothetical protein V8F20_007362 [Naviculisporaceae sp. PSN 640]